MKEVLLSADGEISVFRVPDHVADNLEKYCLDFSCHWLHESPDAAKYRVDRGDGFAVNYNEKDFIAYLNQFVCPEPSTLVTTLSNVFSADDVPEEYFGLPYFNF